MVWDAVQIENPNIQKAPGKDQRLPALPASDICQYLLKLRFIMDSILITKRWGFVEVVRGFDSTVKGFRTGKLHLDSTLRDPLLPEKKPLW